MKGLGYMGVWLWQSWDNCVSCMCSLPGPTTGGVMSRGYLDKLYASATPQDGALFGAAVVLGAAGTLALVGAPHTTVGANVAVGRVRCGLVCWDPLTAARCYGALRARMSMCFLGLVSRV
jgi:hypothetical protein